MSSLNKITIIGSLGKDPDVRTMQNGNKVVSFSVATSESWKNKNTGEKETRTEWHKVVVFNDRLTSLCESYLQKGSKVYIEGQLQTRKWTGEDGRENYSTEIVLQQYRGEIMFLSAKKEAQPQDSQNEKPDIGGSYGSDGKFQQSYGSLDCEIPF